MKKVVWFLLACMAAWQVSAQEVHFIPKVGLNFADLTGFWGGKARVGGNIGVAAEVMLTPSFAFEPGIFYSSQGTRDNVTMNTEEWGISSTKSIFRIDYLNIPLYAKYYVKNGFYVFAGPQVGFKVLGKSKMKVDNEWSDWGDLKKGINTFDLSLGLGLGYQFDCGFLCALNYNVGLTHATKIANSRNSVFQANIGWRF